MSVSNAPVVLPTGNANLAPVAQHSVYRIALVDDHALVREGLRQLLATEEQLEVVFEASSGEELLEQLHTHSCDLIILDLSMPGRGGLSALRTISRRYPQIRTLVLTMFNEPEYLRKAIEARASGYLLKDESFDCLTRAVAAIRDGGRFYTERVPLSHEEIASLEAAGEQLLALDRNEIRQAAPHRSSLELLTPRELQILRLIARGQMNKEIASDLGISKRTVELHRANIMEQPSLRNLSELVRFAVAEGLA